MMVSLLTSGKGVGPFVHVIMCLYNENKKQTEELNSSKIKEILLSFGQTLRFIETEYELGITSSFECHVELATLFNETSRKITDVSGTFRDLESGENLFDVSTFLVQSDTIDRVETTEATEIQVNVGFDNIEEEAKVGTEVVQQLYKPTGSANADIARFLSRPVEIAEITWTIGGTINSAIKPWHLFFNHASIKKKIDNYAFVRCDLHLKFMINASPFYYSGLLISYNPLGGKFGSADLPAASASQLVGYSQRSHLIAYPQNNEAGEMTLPFIYPYEWLDLTSSTILQQMGVLDFDSFEVLRNVGSSTGPITMQVYAWADNVQLAGLTVDLAVQSGQYHKGPLSKPASAVARATGMLQSLPVVGSFMTATSIAAQGVADIAGLFGYTKVPVLNDVQAFKNLPFHGLATAEISDCTERLCIDSKNEMTIDTKVIGDKDNDSLDLSKFVQRKSYLTSFTWEASNASKFLLWNSYVTPFMSVVAAGTGQSIVNGTPMWLVANMFDYWRGDIIFDLNVLCSQYHRGRLRVSWDPVGDVANTPDSSTEVYTTIIDISEKTEATIRVPYMQRTAYQKIPSDMDTTIYDTLALAKDSSDTVNGILTVRVLNELSAPQTSADVTVLVSVRGAENLEFAAPKEIPNDLYYFTVQSGEEEQDFAGSSSTDPNLNLVYMGEKVVNLRSLMMRCNYFKTDVNDASLSGELYETCVINRRPIFKGFDPNGTLFANQIVGASTSLYNFVKNTPYHMISQCFLGERGSFTWKFDLNNTHNTSITISRPKLPLNKSNYNFNSSALYALSNTKVSAKFADDEYTNSGIALINQETNTGLSVNSPQYSIVSFLDTRPSQRVEGLSTISGDDALSVVYVSRRTFDVPIITDPLTTPVPGVDYFNHYFQVGPDYAPVYFMNVPTMYIYDSVPTGV